MTIPDPPATANDFPGPSQDPETRNEHELSKLREAETRDRRAILEVISQRIYSIILAVHKAETVQTQDPARLPDFSG